MQNTRYCQQKGHEMNEVILICAHYDCNQVNKWVCDDCVSQQTHSHGQLNSNHLLNQQQFLDFINKQYLVMHEQNTTNKNLIQIIIKHLQSFILSSQTFFQQLKEDIIKLNVNANQEEIKQIIIISTNNFEQLQNQQIKKIINLCQTEKIQDYNLQEDKLKISIKNYQEILNQMKLNNQQDDVFVENGQKDNNNFKQDPYQYESHIKYHSVPWINAAQISSDEKYLAIGGNNNRIQIFDLNTKDIIKCLDIKRRVNQLKFTNDSKYLVCGDIRGFISIYEANNNFKQILKTRVHSSMIQDIITIDNNQIITCSDDKSIIVTNSKLNKKCLQIKNTHSLNIRSIDYDRQNNMIISCSDDKSIKFFSKINGQMQIEQILAHNNNILYVQLQDKNQLMSCSYEQIIQWNIDYHQQKLIQIKQLAQFNFSFSTIFNSQKMVLVSENFVQILDENLIPIQQFEHRVKEFLYYFKMRQIKSMNYIIVEGKSNLYLYENRQFIYIQKSFKIRVKMIEKRIVMIQKNYQKQSQLFLLSLGLIVYLNFHFYLTISQAHNPLFNIIKILHEIQDLKQSIHNYKKALELTNQENKKQQDQIRIQMERLKYYCYQRQITLRIYIIFSGKQDRALIEMIKLTHSVFSNQNRNQGINPNYQKQLNPLLNHYLEH